MSQNLESIARAVTHDRFGPPADVLTIRPIDVHEPGPGELLIRVLLRPVHPGDIAGIFGPGAGATPEPLVPGLEGMGVVAASGEGVTGWRDGARVAFFPVQGAWSDLVVAPAELCVALPEGIADAIGSLALINPITVQMLMREVQAGWGETAGPFVQTAAGSSVGKLVSAHAARHGYPLVNLVRSTEGAAVLNERFPSIPTISTSDQDWGQKVGEALGGPASVVLDAVGGDSTGPLLDLLVDGGTLVAYGALAGPSMAVSAAPVIGRGLRVHGVTILRWLTTRTAEERAQDVAGAISLASGAPELFEVAETYDLADFLTAIEHAQRPGKVGTVLLASPGTR